MTKPALAAALAAAACLLANPVAAQTVHAKTVASDLTIPVAFVQDPTLPNVQYIVEQHGRIRTLQDGQLLETDFLNLSDVIATALEDGILGMAFAPDYATSGRFFVNFINPDGNTVIARFLRSADDPLVADPNSRFDLVWPSGEPFIVQPYGEHDGGDLAFGPDGYLYIGLGDGGSGDDPDHRAQNPGELLGKMLRIDVSVGDDDPEGYDVPDDNPFVGVDGVLPEIWAFGLRNPWRYSFDNPAVGGTGALIIADVGQAAMEEINYEPAGVGGRNYGWRNYEGTLENVTSLPLAYEPATFPVFEYDHSVGQTIIGGFIYRGTALDPSFVGQYFFADFVQGRVWSLELSIDPSTGEATAGSLHEHTEALGGSALGLISSMGVDAAGELYIVSWTEGKIFQIAPGAKLGPTPQIQLDPGPAAPVTQPFAVSGWAVDLGADTGNGVDFVHVWAVPQEGPAVFLGASEGLARPDVEQSLGLQFANSGFSVTASGLPAGTCQIIAFAHSTVTDTFAAAAVMVVDIPPAVPLQMAIEQPSPNSSFPGIVTLTGYAFDPSGLTGNGIDLLHVWGVPDVGAAQFLGWSKTTIDRPDISSQFGSRFLQSGWTLTATDLQPGWWTLVVYAHSSVTHTFRDARTVRVFISEFAAGMRLVIEQPQQMQTITLPGPNLLRGWALDLGAAPGTSGVDTVHVWAVPTNGDPAFLLGMPTMGVSRPDIAADFGLQFDNCGFEMPLNLPAGTYNLVIYAYRSRTQNFAAAAVVTVIVQEPPPTNATISTSDPSSTKTSG